MTDRAVLGKRVLIADDEPTVRQALKWMLMVDHHDVTEAATGREALNLFEKGKYDLVITDFFMPAMGGEELAAEIKRISPAQPIILATANVEYVAGGPRFVDTILNKPFCFADLRTAIKRALPLMAA